jgi:hypothetical protein
MAGRSNKPVPRDAKAKNGANLGFEQTLWQAADKLRALILKTKTDFSNDRLRIMVRRQHELWQEGVSIGEMFARQKAALESAVESEGEGDEEADDSVESAEQIEIERHEVSIGDYGGGKWGRYLRAPDFYFEIMRQLGSRFTRLGEVATIKFGIKSGCDAFFMPRNISGTLLDEAQEEFDWRALPLMRRCKRAEVGSGEVVIVQCGDKTIHPIERRFVRPEVHSLMQVDRPVVSPGQTDRVVL